MNEHPFDERSLISRDEFSSVESHHQTHPPAPSSRDTHVRSTYFQSPYLNALSIPLSPCNFTEKLTKRNSLLASDEILS